MYRAPTPKTRTAPDEYEENHLRPEDGAGIAFPEQMKSKCNRCGRLGGRNSFYIRRSDQKKIVQYRCFRCKRVWTVGTDNLERYQRLRSENRSVRKFLGSGMTIRRCAYLLGIDPKTVARKAKYWAKKIALENKNQPPDHLPQTAFNELFIDELITYEHTRCKPLAVCMIVNRDRRILGFSVSSMPAIGKHLKRVSLRKYGKRPNHRGRGVAHCLRELKQQVHPETIFYSDEEFTYARLIRKEFPETKHLRFPSKRAVIAGQGELKDRTFDPLFPINHTFAMLRANLARLIRRTWSNTKKASSLSDFLYLYADFHNRELIAQAS